VLEGGITLVVETAQARRKQHWIENLDAVGFFFYFFIHRMRP